MYGSKLLTLLPRLLSITYHLPDDVLKRLPGQRLQSVGGLQHLLSTLVDQVLQM